MNISPRLFLLCLFCFTLPFLDGCGNKSEEMKQVMTDAANQLLTAVDVLDRKLGARVEELLNLPPMTREEWQEAHAAIFNDATLEESRETWATFKMEADAISLDGCSDDFKDAFVAWKEALFAEAERYFNRTYKPRSDTFTPPTDEEARLFTDAYTKIREAGILFRAMCHKLKLDVQVEDRLLAPGSREPKGRVSGMLATPLEPAAPPPVR